MATPDIKAGKYYNLKMLCVLSKDKFIAFKTPSGRYMPLRQCDLECVSPITPSEPPTSACPAPKYDPCRKFRKGDKVRVVEWNGRNTARVGQIGYVVSDERNSKVELAIECWTKDVYYPACHLELVSPVEELEPYRISTNRDCATHAIFKKIKEKDFIVCKYFFTHGRCANALLSEKEALAAAEAECEKLNAEYRKEQEC